MQWLFALSTAAALFILSNIWSICWNYLTARKSGLPIVIGPINPSNILFMVFSVPLRPFFRRCLPESIFERIKPAIYGWEFTDKSALHEKLGSVFLHVTIGGNDLWVADPGFANEILTRRKDFTQLEIGSRIIGLFGPNLLTSDGDDWQRQRRLIAPNLNERISALVWVESCGQASEMIQYLAGSATDQTVDGLRMIAINVLGRAGYGSPQPWKPYEAHPTKPGVNLTYIQAVSSVVNFIVPAAVVPARIFLLPIMPNVLQTLGMAMRQLHARTMEMLDKERSLAESGNGTSGNLMSMLVKLSDDAKKAHRGPNATEKSQYLLEDEIEGNLFLFTAAGFDTTANSLAYAVTLLAAYPKWQEWIFEEIDSVTQGMMDMDYTKVFPRMSRCLALMFEVLRLFPPILHLARESKDHQTLNGQSNTIFHLAPKTKIYINNAALGSNPTTWGADALQFRPSRWLTDHSTASESPLIAMPRGTFLPWSGGPRVCPGQKMSQVEFVAVVMTLFRTCRAEPVLAGGESMETARKRLIETTQDSQPRLTLQMNRPQDVKLRWVRR